VSLASLVVTMLKSFAMFSLYRRHKRSCRFRAKGVRQTTCSCPIWMDGRTARGRRLRRSLDTSNWTRAQLLLDELERSEFVNAAPAKSPTLTAAAVDYLADGAARRLRTSTLRSYAKTLEHLQNFLGDLTLDRITLAELTRFRAARGVSAFTAAKEIQTLRAFFRFAHDRGWIHSNPAQKVRAPRADRMPTLPFTREEVGRILAAASSLDDNRSGVAALQARALVLLLLYSGFRISDAVQLERAALDPATGRLLVRMMKTRQPLYLKLAPEPVAALEALPRSGPRYFWNGRSKLATAIGNARRTIGRVLARARIENGHPHRFRDTFSVELLAHGADLRTVQLLLGHTSLRTTEKHYAPFVASFQRLLDSALANLHFEPSVAPRRKPVVHAAQHALGDSQRNVLAFPRPQRA
jgi:integrase/recombinase XerD